MLVLLVCLFVAVVAVIAVAAVDGAFMFVDVEVCLFVSLFACLLPSFPHFCCCCCCCCCRCSWCMLLLLPSLLPLL